MILCNFDRGYPEEQFYKNYFEFGPVVQEEITFERFHIWSSGSHPVQWRRTIYAIYVKSSVRDNSVILFCIWTSGSGGDVVEINSYLELWQSLRSEEGYHLCNFGRRYPEEQFCEISLNLDQSFRRSCQLK